MHYYATDAQVSSYFKYQFYCICICSLLSPLPLLNTLKEVFQYSPHFLFFIAYLYKHKIKTGIGKLLMLVLKDVNPYHLAEGGSVEEG